MISLSAELNGSQTGSNTASETITLPTYAAGDFILLIVSRNQTGSNWTGDADATVEEIATGSGRCVALKVTPTGLGKASFVLSVTGTAIWRWWIGVYSGNTIQAIGGIGSAVGSNTTAAIPVPSTELRRATNGSEVAISAAGVNATATWTTDANTIFSNASGNASLLVSGKTPSSTQTVITYSDINRGLAGTTRIEESLSLVLQESVATIEVVEAGEGGDSNTSTVTIASFTISAGSNKALVFGFKAFDSANAADRVLSSVTFNGDPFTIVDQLDSGAGGGINIGFAYLLNPDVGNFTFTATFAGIVDDVEYLIVELDNVAQSGQPDDSAEGTSSGTSHSLSVDTTIDNGIVFNVAGIGGSTVNGYGANQANLINNFTTAVASYKFVGAAGSHSMSYTTAASSDLLHSNISLAPFVAEETVVKDIIGGGIIPFPR